MIKGLFNTLLAASAMFSFNQSVAASFDCAKAARVSEIAICSDAELSALDDTVAEEYKLLLNNASDPAAIKSSQIAWIKETRNCGGDVACLKKEYSERIEQLIEAGDPGDTEEVEVSATSPADIRAELAPEAEEIVQENESSSVKTTEREISNAPQAIEQPEEVAQTSVDTATGSSGSEMMEAIDDEDLESLGTLFWILIVATTSIWVYFDARSIRKKTNNEKVKPWVWLLSCLGIWIIAFPIYIYQRFMRRQVRNELR